MDNDVTLARIVCAWCDRLLQDGEGDTSHGICDSCLPRVLAEAARRFDADTSPPETPGAPPPSSI